MSRTVKLASLSAMAVMLLQVQALAGTLGLSAVPSGAFDTNFNPVPIPDISENQGEPVILVMDLAFAPTPGDGERDFLNMALNVGLGNLVDVGGGYLAQPSPEVDVNPNPIITDNQPVFNLNGDQGAPGDLQGIILSKAVPLGDTDPRTTFDGYPFTFGQIFVQWDGQPTELTITGASSFNLLTGEQPSSEEFEPFVVPFGSGVEPVELVGAVNDDAFTGMGDSSDDQNPEMVTLQGAFADLSGSRFGAISVSTSPDAGDLTVLDLIKSNESHPVFPDPAVGAEDGSVSDIDLFLDVAATQGLPLGTLVSYDLEVVTNYGSLFYQVKATVPEPSTVALSVLAFVGLVGFARRNG